MEYEGNVRRNGDSEYSTSYGYSVLDTVLIAPFNPSTYCTPLQYTVPYLASSGNLCKMVSSSSSQKASPPTKNLLRIRSRYCIEGKKKKKDEESA